jgi:hypothetical protein
LRQKKHAHTCDFVQLVGIKHITHPNSAATIAPRPAVVTIVD